MHKFLAIILLSGFLQGCAPSSSEYLKPSGKYGKTTIDGCDQVPRTFRYEEQETTLKLKLYYETLALNIEALNTDQVTWNENKVKINIDGEIYNLKASELVKSHERDPCGGFTETFGCTVYQVYNARVKIPFVENADTIIVYPPIPSVNGEALKVDKIIFKRVTETLWTALNC